MYIPQKTKKTLNVYWDFTSRDTKRQKKRTEKTKNTFRSSNKCLRLLQTPKDSQILERDKKNPKRPTYNRSQKTTTKTESKSQKNAQDPRLT